MENDREDTVVTSYTEGQEIVHVARTSAFIDDETLAKWIDQAITDSALKAKRAEQDRIEKMIGTMGPTDLEKAISQCRFKYGGSNEGVI